MKKYRYSFRRGAFDLSCQRGEEQLVECLWPEQQAVFVRDVVGDDDAVDPVSGQLACSIFVVLFDAVHEHFYFAGSSL